MAAKLGSYDFDKQVFAFRPFASNSVYSVVAPKEYGCDARHLALPEEFAVRFENYDLINGIPLASDNAEQLIKSRTQRPGVRDDNVIIDVDLEFAGKSGDPKETETGLLHVRKRISSVAAQILDYAVYANASAPEPFARLTEERKKAYSDEKARIAAEDAADVKLNQEFSWTLLGQQFKALKAGPPDFAGRRTRVAFSGALEKSAVNADGTRLRIGQLAKDFSYEQRSDGSRAGTNLQFVNPNPVDSIDVPADLARRFNQNPSTAKLNRLYLPVGIIDDEAAGRSTVVGQIVGLEVEVSEDGRRFRHFVAIPGDPKPFAFQRDERPASAFEIAGLKLGMSPEAVAENALQRFGVNSNYDPLRRILTSTGVHCAASGLTNLDEKPCLTADFDVAGHGWLGGEKLGVTRLTISQGIQAEELTAFIAGFRKQFGEPRVEWTSGNTIFMAWGAVVSKQREPESNAQAAWHVVELEIHRTVMGAASRFMLTDPAFLANRTEGSDGRRLSQR